MDISVVCGCRRADGGPADALRARRHGQLLAAGSYAVAAESVLGEECPVVADEYDGARVAGDRDGGAASDDGVDRAALPAELAQIGLVRTASGSRRSRGSDSIE